MLAHLQSLGVDLRPGNARGLDYEEKLAATTGAAWGGSTNATYARGSAGEKRNWGLATRKASLVMGVQKAFERSWHDASTFVGAIETSVRSSAVVSRRRLAACVT